jgi:probable rRNA maturation factor
MNKTYLKRKGPTDVISFPGIYLRRPVRFRRSAQAFKYKDPLGDIAISPATARRYAKPYGQKLPDELKALILHGVLHLLGYDHETDNGRMNRVERRLLRRFELL